MSHQLMSLKVRQRSYIRLKERGERIIVSLNAGTRDHVQAPHPTPWNLGPVLRVCPCFLAHPGNHSWLHSGREGAVTPPPPQRLHAQT